MTVAQTDAALRFCRLIEVPAPAGTTGATGPAGAATTGDPAAALRGALLPALVSAYAAGLPVVVSWVRPVAGGPVWIVLGGDLAGGSTEPPASPDSPDPADADSADSAEFPGSAGANGLVRPTYPPGSRATPLPAARFWQALHGLPAWVRCTGRADALSIDTDGDRPQPTPAGGFDEFVAHLAGAPFAWLVRADPLPRAAIQAMLTELRFRVNRLLDVQAASGHDRIELERAQARQRELTRALATGLWNVHVLAGGRDEVAVRRAAALLCAARDLAPLPYTLHPGDQPVRFDAALAAAVADGDLGESPFAASAELVAAIARPPVRELPGIRLVEPPRFDVTPETCDGVPLGTVLDAAGVPAGRFHVPTATLNRHAFVAGATGSGKSQTVRHLLEGLHRGGVPWLVIEPAKAEYARMAGRLDFGAEQGQGEVVVIRPGDPDHVAVSLNPLEPEAGFPLQTHLDLVRALFLAAFDANEPFPQVLARALTRCYEELGWDLTLGTATTGTTTGRGDSPPTGGTPRYPTLGDLQRVAQDVVSDVGYGPEMTSDVRGFIDVRLGALRLGTPGRFFDGGHPLDVADLLCRNVVLELEDVGNDQDKAFCIGAVLIRLVEHLRVHRHTPGPERLRHVTVVEEAHRLLRAGTEGTPAAHAVELFASLLAEIRAYGEGVIVAEQIPSKLLPDVVKNSALKVLHRLPAADDRASVGATMNLDEQQSRHVVSLPPGEAAVFTDGMDRPVLIRVPFGEDRERTSATPARPGIGRTRTEACGAHCRARPCTLREVVAGRDLATDPRLSLWAELLVVAHLSGEPRPRIRPTAAPGLLGDLPHRTVECALAHVAQRSVEIRYAELLPWYQPELLGRHVAHLAAAQLFDGAGWCDPLSEVEWQAGRFRWVDIGRSLSVWEGRRDRLHPDTGRWRERGVDLSEAAVGATSIDAQITTLRADPTRGVSGRALLFGSEPLLDRSVNALSRRGDPVARLGEAAAFLDPRDTGWFARRLLPGLVYADPT